MNAPPRHQLFGFGSRRKLLYARGALCDALSGEVLQSWPATAESFDPAGASVRIETAGGAVTIEEDEQGVWIEEGGGRRPLTSGAVALPTFAGHPHAAVLRRLHGELLVNLLPQGPLPNLWVYKRPWHRDAAMVCMCLQRTGNLRLVEPWIAGLREVFDRNNAGETEADNVGQVLYLASLVGGRRHPVVEPALRAAEAMRRGASIHGRSDFAEHPVYQTKWLKFGLRALGLDDPYVIPKVADSYSALFWMDWRDEHVAHPPFDAASAEKYPYLAWAEAHFHDAAPPAWANEAGGVLTWEADASQADYARMSLLDAGLRDRRVGTPHTWHAAEMFLYLVERTHDRPV